MRTLIKKASRLRELRMGSIGPQDVPAVHVLARISNFPSSYRSKKDISHTIPEDGNLIVVR